jgi:protein KRI1
MAGTKDKKHSNGVKRALNGDSAPVKSATERPAKKAKLLDNTDDEGSSDGDEGDISLKVNEKYAKRFEYNKKREEQHRREPHHMSSVAYR